MRRILVLIFFFLSAALYAQHSSDQYPNKAFVITPHLDLPLGTVVTVEGRIVNNNSKAYESFPKLMLYKINDSIFQNPISMYLTGSYSFNYDDLSSLEMGEFFRMSVFETGSFFGLPKEALPADGIAMASVDFHCVNLLEVLSCEKLDDFEWTPKSFVDRKAILVGESKNWKGAACIIGSDWKVKLAGVPKWKSKEVFKKVSVEGIIRETEDKNVFYLEEASFQMLNFEDMLDKKVKLRGEVWSNNGKWVFSYYGKHIYLPEGLQSLPNWSVNNHGAAIELSGDLKLIDSETRKKLKNTAFHRSKYMLMNPSWKPIKALMVNEVVVIVVGTY